MSLYEKIAQVHEGLILKMGRGYEHRTPDELLDNAIESWITIFYPFPAEANSIGKQCLTAKELSHKSRLLGVIDSLIRAIPSLNTIDYGDKNNYQNLQRRNSMQAWPYLIVGLVIVILATIILYNKRQSLQSLESSNTAAVFDRELPRSASSLFIVINAERKDLILDLSNVSQGSTDVNWKILADKLYKSSKALWMGASQSPEAQKIREVSQKSHISNLSSEYDVHVVEIALKESSEGFKRNANPVDRRDAFGRLASNCTKIVQVSSRLSSSSYEGFGFYI